MTRKQDILDENTKRTKGSDALNSNIEAAKALASIVKTTLGPMGMDKMLIDSMGESIITNDGVKILKEMEIEHPGAKMLVEVAKTQENEVGDGTTTAVILSGELLSEAQELLHKKIHPTIIVRGYKKASIKAIEILKENSINIDTTSKKALQDICETAMTGKVADSSKEVLSEILYHAVTLVSANNEIPSDSIRDIANSNMPKKIIMPNVLLIDFPLEVRELDSSANLQISTPQDYENFLNREHEYLKNLATKITKIGCNVVICQKGIDDNVAYYLAKNNILAVRRTRKSDMKRLSIALNARIISNVEDLHQISTAKASVVEVKKLIDENYVFIEGLNEVKAITLVLKASTKHILDEIERAADDAIGDLNSVLKSKKIVAGGGAIELEIYKNLMQYSRELEGKEQLVVEAYAKAFLSIPKTLCENSGFDEIETISKLISNHEKGLKKSGIEGFTGVVADTTKYRIIEPINLKLQAIKSATEISSMILRIDDIIAARKLGTDIRGKSNL